MVELIDKFIDKLLEGQLISSSKFGPTPVLTIADALEKDLESRHLTPCRFTNFLRKSDQMA